MVFLKLWFLPKKRTKRLKKNFLKNSYLQRFLKLTVKNNNIYLLNRSATLFMSLHSTTFARTNIVFVDFDKRGNIWMIQFLFVFVFPQLWEIIRTAEADFLLKLLHDINYTV